MIGIAVEASDLEEAAVAFEQQVTEAVAANPEIKEMVEQLEEQQDEVAGFSQEDGPERRRDRPRVPAVPPPAERLARVGVTADAGGSGSAPEPRQASTAGQIRR